MSKGEITRQRIIAEAAPIFNQRGFAGCSMHDIMEATGLEKGGLYRHFSSKDELAIEAFRYSLDAVTRVRLSDDPTIAGAIPKLLHQLHQFVHVPSPVKGGCPLMNTAIDSDDTHPELCRLAREAIQGWKARLKKILEEGIRTGEIRKDVQPEQIANVIVATLEGALMISRVEDSRQAIFDAEATLRGLISSFAESAAPAPPNRKRQGITPQEMRHR